MSRKTRTPQQVRNRFVIAVTLIGFMLLYTAGSNVRMRHRQSLPTHADTVAVLDHQLDSLLEADYADAAMKSAGPYEYRSERIRAEQELGLLEELMSEADLWNGSAAERNRRRMDELKGLIAALPEGKTSIVRSVTVIDNAAGRVLYGEQSADAALKGSELDVRLTEPVGYRDGTVDRIENELTE